MTKVSKITTITIGVALTLALVAVLGFGSFKQREKVYTYIDYDFEPETGYITTKVEGQTLSINADKIVSLPTDYEAGNALYVSEYKTFFFTKTVYEVKRLVILIPTDGKGDDWKLGL